MFSCQHLLILPSLVLYHAPYRSTPHVEIIRTHFTADILYSYQATPLYLLMHAQSFV